MKKTPEILKIFGYWKVSTISSVVAIIFTVLSVIFNGWDIISIIILLIGLFFAVVAIWRYKYDKKNDDSV